MSTENSVVPVDVTFWTSYRQRIHAWLQEVAPSLAELYKGAVCILSNQTIPGRVRFISHAVREIRNRIPGEVSTRLDYSQEVEQLCQSWTSHDLPLESMIADVGTPYDTQLPSLLLDISIPKPLFVEIQMLLQKHSSIRPTNRDRARRLFERFVPEAQSTPEALKLLVGQWWDTTEWFMKNTHDGGQVSATCDEGEIQSRFAEFESFLGTLSQNFYSNTDELDKILEDTNA